MLDFSPILAHRLAVKKAKSAPTIPAMMVVITPTPPAITKL